MVNGRRKSAWAFDAGVGLGKMGRYTSLDGFEVQPKWEMSAKTFFMPGSHVALDPEAYARQLESPIRKSIQQEKREENRK